MPSFFVVVASFFFLFPTLCAICFLSLTFDRALFHSPSAAMEAEHVVDLHRAEGRCPELVADGDQLFCVVELPERALVRIAQAPQLGLVGQP